MSLSFILRTTVSRPVCLGIKYPSGAYDQILITVRQLRVCWSGALSLTGGRVCRLRLLLALSSAVILESESILLYQIRYLLFVASYDSQGYGGGIRHLLHTGLIWLHFNLSFLLYSVSVSTETSVYHSATGLLSRIYLRGNMFADSFSSNGCTCHNIHVERQVEEQLMSN
jgi:hypothetical protein